MRTRLFLRNRVFYGEGRKPTKVEAVEESEKMMNVYADFAQNFMAIPVVKGLKQKQSVLLVQKKHIVLRH
jgi:prolyl-tRNA synthetase